MEQPIPKFAPVIIELIPTRTNIGVITNLSYNICRQWFWYIYDSKEWNHCKFICENQDYIREQWKEYGMI